VWIAVLGSVKSFPNLEAALKGVFNRVLNFFPKASEHSFRLKRAFLASNVPSAVHVELNNDAGGALRAAAKRGLAIEL
jgi:hypothetical protein